MKEQELSKIVFEEINMIIKYLKWQIKIKKKYNESFSNELKQLNEWELRKKMREHSKN